MNLGHLFNNAVRSFGEQIAFYDDVRSISFRTLHDRVNRIGNILLDNGIRPGESIASLQNNSLETAEIELAASKYGFSRSLLNARDTVHAHIDALTLIRAKALFFSNEFAAHVELLRSAVPTLQLCIEIDPANPGGGQYEVLIAGSHALEPGHEVTEDWVHSVYFTSGTTGKPKGIVLSQRNWLALVRNHLVDTYANAKSTDVVLHAAPMSHASGALIFAHLVRGARQKVMRRFDAAAVLDAFERDRITTLWLAPTMLIMLLEQMQVERRDVSSLRSMRYGGAAMAAERVRDAVECFGPVLCSGWGQWEAPQQCTFLSQTDIAEAVRSGNHARLASAGRSVTFGGVAIADDDGTLVPAGLEGEIVVCGDHLMVGYLNEPELTAALRFGKWQRTGDVGRMDPEGYLYLTDRKRDLIISGGSNIYPREIEEVLYAHTSILEAVAIGLPNDKWGETVCVVAVLRAGARLGEDELIEWCRQRLADYKRPRMVRFLDELPKNAYGKILKREIRQSLSTAQSPPTLPHQG